MNDKKVGLLINTFNRPEYLQRCIDSVRNANLSGVQILIVDDCSTDRRVYEILSGFMIHRMDRNRSIRWALEKGMQILFDTFKCDVVINLDSDAIVHPEFAERLLKLHEEFPNEIITGFNSIVAGRHQIVSQHNGYCIKKSCGGINMLISRNIYETVLKKALTTAQRTSGHWDDIVCKYHVENVGNIICSTPSVVQHIGFKSSMGHNVQPDVSHDFLYSTTKKLLILQPFGIGDVIFSRTLVKMLGDYQVTWPVMDRFVNDLNRAYPDINFIPASQSPVDLELKRDIEVSGFRTIPIRWSNFIMRTTYNRVMRAKYDMYKFDYRLWRKAALWERDIKKENELFELLELEGKEYTLINSYFGSDGQFKIDIPVSGIEMRDIPGYSLFDWAKVFENSKEIHTVSTSILYVLDMLNTCDVNVYVRKPIEKSHQNYNYIFNANKFNYK